MKFPRVPHSWNVIPRRAVRIQRDLAGRVIRTGRIPTPTLIAGADLAFVAESEECIAGVVVWHVTERRIVEERVVRRPTRFPYIPGLLSFREAPALAAVFRKLRSEPDAFMFDGQGYAHPRRFGLACHMGVLLDRPALGCAKSVLVGDFDLLGKAQWSTAPLIHHGEQVGLAVRTRAGVKPVFVSVGHRMSLRSAVALTRMCTTRYRIPEPTRLADALVARVKRAT